MAPTPRAPAEASPRRQCGRATAIAIPIAPAITQTEVRIHIAILSVLVNGPFLITVPFPTSMLWLRRGLAPIARSILFGNQCFNVSRKIVPCRELDSATPVNLVRSDFCGLPFP